MELNDALKQALADLPPLSEERHRILQPLTDEELFAYFQRVRLDRVDHERQSGQLPSGQSVGACYGSPPDPAHAEILQSLMSGGFRRSTSSARRAARRAARAPAALSSRV
jgi:hypothetical protein